VTTGSDRAFVRADRHPTPAGVAHASDRRHVFDTALHRDMSVDAMNDRVQFSE
jgi:hypothetical protein